MPPKRRNALEKGRHRSRPPRPPPQSNVPADDMGSRSVDAGTVPTDGAGIQPRVVLVPATRTTPVKNNEVLDHLSFSQRVAFGKVMQAVMNYWYLPMFEEELAKLCSDKIWIDRLVAQPMADCTILFAKDARSLCAAA